MPFKKQTAKNTLLSTDMKSIFIARTNELLFFIHHILEPEEPAYNIISISGQGGIGKSTLMNHFIEEALATNFKDYCITAKIDERLTTPASIMEHFANQFRTVGQPLKKFEEALAGYKESLRRTQGGQEVEQGILIRDAADIVGIVAEDIPFVGGLVHKGTNTITELLIDKAQRRQRLKDTARLEDPIGILTRAFITDLNQITELQVVVGPHWIKRHRRIILFFDTFEQLASDIVPWLLDYFLEADISTNIVLVFAGRDSIEKSTHDERKRWLPYFDNKDIYLIALHSFTEQETTAYLAERGINDSVRVNQIWHMSRGLPLYLGLLTSNPEGNIDPTADVVENFLRWIPKEQQLKRRLALDASLLTLPFNQDDLTAFTYLGNNHSQLYQWLIDQPFVRSNPQDGRHSFHDLAQEMFSRHLYQRSSREWYTTREMIANYYQQHIEKLEAEGGKEIFKTDEWLDLMLASAQQLFLLPNETNRKTATEQILIAYEHASEQEKIARMLRSLCLEQGDHHPHIRVPHLCKQLLQCIEAGIANDNTELLTIVNTLLEYISHISSFSKEALAYLYRRRGYTFRVLERYEQALIDFDNALALMTNYARAYAGRGETYRLVKNYQQALTNFDRAIELNISDDWSYARRGLVYTYLKDYQQALTNFDRAIELEPKYIWAYFSRGLVYRDLKDFEHATQDFTDALNLDPQYKWAYDGRGLVYRDLKDFEHAIQDFTHALKLDPHYIAVYNNRGLAYRDLKDFEHAIQDFTDAIELDPHYIAAYNGRGLAYRDLKDFEHAIQDFTHALELTPQDTNAAIIHNNRGLVYRDLKDYEWAIQDFTRAIELDPQYKWAYFNRGLAYQDLKDFEHAIEDFTHAIDLDPQYIAAYNSRGLAYRNFKDYEHAIQDYTCALELNPQDTYAAIVYCNRGLAYRDLKDLEHAIEEFTHALELDIQCKWAYSNRGDVYRNLKDFEHAIEDFTHAIDLDPQNVALHNARGLAYRDLKDFERAIQDFTRAIALDSQYKWAYVNRSDVYKSLKDYEQAIQDCNRAIELDPQYIPAYNGRGLAYRDLKDYERAIQDFTHALELDPQNVAAYNGRGLAYGGFKDFERAIQDFTRALELDPQNVAAYNSRGLTYRYLKDYERATQDFTRAIAIDPQYKWAYSNRGNNYRDLKDYERATQDFTHAIYLDPQYAYAYYGRGYVYLWLRNLIQADAEFSQSWKLDPTDLNNDWMVEFVEICLQKPDNLVIECLETLAKIDLQSKEAHLCVGVAQWLRGNFEQALEELEHAFNMGLESEDAYFWRGMVYASLLKDDRAIADLEKSLELDLPPVLLAPLYRFERERPEFYEKYAKPLLERFE